jgi:ubiquinone/menaquinone biosynthesis C-methylase UbiE
MFHPAKTCGTFRTAKSAARFAQLAAVRRSLIDPDEEDVSHNRKQVSRVTRSKEQAKSTYDGVSRWYDLLAGGFEGKHRAAGVVKLNPSEGDVILEIGFGTGHSILALADAVGSSGKVYGIDISQGMLEVTRSRVEKVGLTERVILERGDAAQLPFDPSFFDNVFMSFTLELFDTPEIPVVLAECRRVLRSGGRICVVAMSKMERPNAITRLYEWLHEKLPQYVDCRPIYVQESIRSAGFHIIDATGLALLGLRGEIVLAEKD